MATFLKQHHNYQLSLFPSSWAEINKAYQNIQFHAHVLFEEKYLSFNPSDVHELDEDEYNELIFLHVLFNKSGLPKEYVNAMLKSNIQKPYCYKIKAISWDFDNCRWIDLEELFQYRRKSMDYIEEIVSEMDVEELERLRNHIENTIASKNDAFTEG